MIYDEVERLKDEGKWDTVLKLTVSDLDRMISTTEPTRMCAVIDWFKEQDCPALAAEWLLALSRGGIL
jgi:hypothetical protein